MMKSSDWESMNLAQANIRGLGPKSREKLAGGGFDSVSDLLHLLPRDYLDYSKVTPIHEAPMGQPIQVQGRILSTKATRSPVQRIDIFEALVDDDYGTLRLLWFNRPWLKQQISKGMRVAFFGKVVMDKPGRTMKNPDFKSLEEEQEQRGITPVYRQVGALRSEQIAVWIQTLLAQMPEREQLPSEVVARFGFPSRKAALKTLHTPSNIAEVSAIRGGTSPSLQRLIFEEFLAFQQRLFRYRETREDGPYPRPQLASTWLDTFLDQLPFSLTGEQQQVVHESLGQLSDGQRLHALIQGDVGCGKTVVGLAIAYLMGRAGYQTALLCPTSVLAAQHAKTARQMFEPLGQKVAHLSSGSSGPELKRSLAALAAGEVHLAVGTHRLLQKDVAFSELGLVLIDEQHRFGVDQRAALLKKGACPHYLAFSATPIPRSLALTVHGEFDIYQIREKPAGRQEIRTILKKTENRAEVIQFAQQRIALGESVFWVFPLIEEEGEESERQRRGAQDMYEHFRGIFDHVGLVHGRMKREEIGQVMNDFEQGRLQVLVATTVIEVGVDVPDATIMVVEGANHFGLSQLHQLRGRVGRGGKQAYCFLLAEKPGKDALRRLKMLASSTDGFKIAEFDLQQRGAGDLLGKQQSGRGMFRIGDPWLHREWMDHARKLARSTSNPDEPA